MAARINTGQITRRFCERRSPAVEFCTKCAESKVVESCDGLVTGWRHWLKCRNESSPINAYKHSQTSQDKSRRNQAGRSDSAAPLIVSTSTDLYPPGPRLLPPNTQLPSITAAPWDHPLINWYSEPGASRWTASNACHWGSGVYAVPQFCSGVPTTVKRA